MKITTTVRMTVVVLVVAFGVTVATFSVTNIAGPAAAQAADNDDSDTSDEDECEELERVFNEATKVASEERAAGHWAGWNLMQHIAEETYLDAELGGCEWAAEAPAPTRTGRIPRYVTQDVTGYNQTLQSNELAAEPTRLRLTSR